MVVTQEKLNLFLVQIFIIFLICVQIFILIYNKIHYGHWIVVKHSYRNRNRTIITNNYVVELP